MPSIKKIKAIAHNTAHSYLSLMNYDGAEYIVERLFQIAKNTKQTNIKINILKPAIEPVVYETPEIINSLKYLKCNLEQLLKAEAFTFEDIQSATISIDFKLEETKQSENVPGLELPKYKCESEIVDLNGKVHKKEIVEWWNY